MIKFKQFLMLKENQTPEFENLKNLYQQAKSLNLLTSDDYSDGINMLNPSAYEIKEAIALLNLRIKNFGAAKRLPTQKDPAYAEVNGQITNGNLCMGYVSRGEWNGYICVGNNKYPLTKYLPNGNLIYDPSKRMWKVLSLEEQ